MTVNKSLTSFLDLLFRCSPSQITQAKELVVVLLARSKSLRAFSFRSTGGAGRLRFSERNTGSLFPSEDTLRSESNQLKMSMACSFNRSVVGVTLRKKENELDFHPKLDDNGCGIPLYLPLRGEVHPAWSGVHSGPGAVRRSSRLRTISARKGSHLQT